jgi:hypothetical protein
MSLAASANSRMPPIVGGSMQVTERVVARIPPYRSQYLCRAGESGGLLTSQLDSSGGYALDLEA